MDRENDTAASCCSPASQSIPPKQGKTGLFVSLGASVMAVIAGIGCCGLPVLSGFLTTVGVGSGFLASLQPFQPYLIGLALVVLAFEFYKAYRPRKADECCSSKGKKVALWVITVLLISGLIFTTSVNSTQSNSSEISTQSPPPCCPE